MVRKTTTADGVESDGWDAFVATALSLWGENPAFHQLVVASPVTLREVTARAGRTPAVLQRLLAQDAAESVRQYVARVTDDPDLLNELADDPSMDVQAEVALNIYTTQATRRKLLREGRAPVKMRVITSPLTETSVIEDFLGEIGDGVDEDGLPWAVKIARFCPNLGDGLLQHLLGHPDERVRQGLSNNESDYPGKAAAVEQLSRDPSPAVRTELVMTYDTPAEMVNRMCDDESDPLLRLWFVSNAYGVSESTIDKVLADPNMQDPLRDLEQRRGGLPQRLAGRRTTD